MEIQNHGTGSLRPASAVIATGSERQGVTEAATSAGPPASAPYVDIEDVIGYDALWESMERCKRGVMWKPSVARFLP